MVRSAPKYFRRLLGLTLALGCVQLSGMCDEEPILIAERVAKVRAFFETGKRPSTEEISKADVLVKELTSENYDERETAREKIRALYPPLTPERVDFWEVWLAERIKSAGQDPELLEQLRKVSVIETVVGKLGREPAKDSIFSYYINPKGETVLHGSQLLMGRENPAFKCSLCHGTIHGERIEYSGSHMKSVRTYQFGKLEGPEVEYFSNGSVSWKGQNVAGLADGIFVAYNPEGKELGRYEMHAGTGTRKEWHANGKLALAAEMQKGVPSGKLERWDPDGQLIVLQNFKFLPVDNDGIPNGQWKEVKFDGTAQQPCIDIDVREGVPWEGRARVKFDQKIAEPTWIYFHEGRLYFDPDQGPQEPRHEFGAFEGAVTVGVNCEENFEIKIANGQIVSGTFGILRFHNGQPIHYLPRMVFEAQEVPEFENYLHAILYGLISQKKSGK